VKVTEQTEHKSLAENMGYLEVYGILLNRILKKRVRHAFKWHMTRAIIGMLRTQELIFNKMQGISRLNKGPLVS
jgi:hypothetical protein